MEKVLIPQDIVQEGKDYLKKHGHEVVIGSAFDIETIKREVADADALLVRTASYPAEVLEAGKKLKVISRHGVGVDNIDVKKATELGIRVTYTPEANASTVSELALGFLIALARKIVVCDKATRSNNFNIRNTLPITDLSGKTLSIIGFGRIGKLVARKAMHGLDMNIVVYDPYVKAVPEGINLVKDLKDALKVADFISLHLPSTEETRNLINSKTIKLMKKSVNIVNCARGDLVNESEITTALREGQIAGLATDVFAQEPPPKDHPFFDLENVILTPHNASLTYECMVRMAVQAAEGIVDVLSGKEPTWALN